MIEELKPCPVCGKPVKLEGGQSWHDQHCFLIKCYECGCIRVADTEKGECARRWNSLPRHLRWTKGQPKKSGLYWYRENENDIGRITSVYNIGGKWDMNYIDDDYFYDFPTGGQWAGPLEMPLDDKRSTE